LNPQFPADCEDLQGGVQEDVESRKTSRRQWCAELWSDRPALGERRCQPPAGPMV